MSLQLNLHCKTKSEGFTLNKIKTNVEICKPESSDENDCKNVILSDYKKLKKSNLRKRKADKKNHKTMENHEKKIKLENKISIDEKAREKMFQLYQPWVLSTYGDESKSKTITLKKQLRIVNALRGLEIKDNRRPDSSKFKFWIKSKGFMIDDELENHYESEESGQVEKCKLLVPSRTVISNIFFKRVAIVELFFDIIYKVHCSIGPNEIRHVGQKRTYRKITEYFAFLPREAVTKFLTQCEGCLNSSKFRNLKTNLAYVEVLPDKYRDSSDDENYVTNEKCPDTEVLSAKNNRKENENFDESEVIHRSPNEDGANHAAKHHALRTLASHLIEFQSKTLKLDAASHVDSFDSITSDKKPTYTNNGDNTLDSDHPAAGSSLSKCRSRHNNLADSTQPIASLYLMMTRSMGLKDEDALNLDSVAIQSDKQDVPTSDETYTNLIKDADKLKLMLLAWNYQNSAAVQNGTSGPDLSMMTSLWEQYQSALGVSTANKSHDTVSPTPTLNHEELNSPSDNKEDDDGSETESDERLDSVAYDPERLKAFNMFVRLFVDENLDRMTPISKQPKEKVQAIIDSCARQFPEFSERARKRLRTYLKSCRRNKKTKDGWEHQPSRPTPAHLTSIQAEKILSLACENESHNAKRMRIGLEPISQSLNIPTSSDSRNTQSYTTAKSAIDSISSPLTISSGTPNCKMSPLISTNSDLIPGSMKPTFQQTKTSNLPFDFCKPLLHKVERSNLLNFSGCPTFGTSPEPTDLSVKRPLLPHNLNLTEAVAVKQLITGYREAAAFLLRSADELEQLLSNQHT